MIRTFKEVQVLLKENQIEMVDFKMVDLDGKWRHLTIPAQNFTEDIMIYGVGFDASSYGFAVVEKSDMIFIPDLSSLVIDPFSKIKTVNMLGDVFVIGKENKPFDQYPRNIAKNAELYMKERGYADEMIIGPEFEFHIFDHVSFEVKPNHIGFSFDVADAEWNTGKDDTSNNGYQVDAKSAYHIDQPSDSAYELRNRMSLLLEEWGVPVKYHHHEVGGSGQQEIEVKLGQMSHMADATMIAKYIIKNCASEAGKTATFMPKPIYKEAGNGMHIHMLLKKNNKSLFYDETGYAHLSQLAHYFMGGILKHIASLCALTNPSTNSYKRLVPGFEAPVTIGYATANRSAIIRIPSYAKSPDTKRFELRNPDATCNPYLAYSAVLMAGLDGIENEIDPKDYHWGPYDFNLYNLTPEEQMKIESVPASLSEALTALENDHDYLTKGGVFPEALLKAWIVKKRAEAKEINQMPHPAEYKKYYNS